jgi:hypothetical protein
MERYTSTRIDKQVLHTLLKLSISISLIRYKVSVDVFTCALPVIDQRRLLEEIRICRLLQHANIGKFPIIINM